MKNITNIDPTELPSLPLAEKAALPNIAAVYFVLDGNDTVLYIGQAQRLITRWMSHHRYAQLMKAGEIRIAWLVVSDPSLLDGIETACIACFEPSLNFAPIERSNGTIRIVVDEDAAIVAELDRIAEAESISRADVLRRAIRRLILTTNLPVDQIAA